MEAVGFEDFFYAPGTFTGHKILGYAFMNLVDVKTMKDWVRLKSSCSFLSSCSCVRRGEVAVKRHQSDSVNF